MNDYSKWKFLSFSPKQQHLKACELLMAKGKESLYRGSCKTTAPQKIDDFSASSLGQQAGLCRANEVILEQVDEAARREMALKGRFYVVHEFCNCLYKEICEWMALSPIDFHDFKALTDRIHWHAKQADLHIPEHQFASLTHSPDKPSDIPYLPVAIYLDYLRSAFNVGSILRTTEALRLGSLYFSEYTPFIDHPKVQKTSMFTTDKVPCFRNVPFDQLPRPFIALETIPTACNLHEFSFPQSFTLLLGNEEYGLSDASLKTADHFVKIPLYGYKNSLNVASAYAIAAAEISRQLRNQ